MPEAPESPRFDRTGRHPADRPRPGSRVVPRLELLEARCLLAGLSANGVLSVAGPRTDPNPAVIRSLPAPASVPSTADSSSTAPSLLADPHQVDSIDEAGAPPPPYFVINEIRTPHGSLVSAQTLPSLPYFGVIGTLGSENTIDVYRLPVGSGVSDIQFDLFANSVAPSLAVRFLLFSGSGQVLGQWSSSDRSSTQYIVADLNEPPQGSALFVGIEVAGSTGSAPPIGYQLWVTILSTSSQPTVGEGRSQPTPPLAAGPSMAPTNLSASGLAASTGGNSPSTPSALRLAGSDIRPATGPLPARSAAPLGGVTAADRDPAPDARSFGVTTTLESNDQPLRTTALAPENERRNTPVSRRDEAGNALVALRGPGEAPLLGAAAIGHWRNAFPANAALRDELASGPNTEASPEESPRGWADGSPVAPPVRADSVAFIGRPVSPALGLAIVVTLNALFSDPCAGFDVLATCLDPKSGRASKGRAKEAAGRLSRSAYATTCRGVIGPGWRRSRRRRRGGQG